MEADCQDERQDRVEGLRGLLSEKHICRHIHTGCRQKPVVVMDVQRMEHTHIPTMTQDIVIIWKTESSASNQVVYGGGYQGGNGKANPVTNLQKTGITITAYNKPYYQHPDWELAGTLHNHAITVTESTRGDGTAHENMPPFYVLAFIMRVS